MKQTVHEEKKSQQSKDGEVEMQFRCQAGAKEGSDFDEVGQVVGLIGFVSCLSLRL